MGTRGWGSEEWQVIKGYRDSAWDDEKVLEMDSGDDCTAVRLYLMPLKSTLKNGFNSKFYVTYILP